MNKDVLREVTIDGKEIDLSGSKWLIEVLDAWEPAESTERILKLRLIGPKKSYFLTLRVYGESLFVEHRRGDVQWILDGVGRYLQQAKIPEEGELLLGA